MKRTFTPAGGMNQDDSIITPTKDYAGENAFNAGDYKYALNMRIGSSKKDNYGDGENIKDTLVKDTYWARAVVNSNPTFASGLTGWSQLSVSGGTAWADVAGEIFFTAAAGSQLSNILYQSVAPTGKRMGFWLKLNVLFTMQNASCRLVFLNGTTVLSTAEVFSCVVGDAATNPSYEKYLNLELPSGCNRVGVQCFGFSVLGNVIEIEGFKFFDWQASSRPAGTERVVGRKEDRENNLLYYAVYNSAGNHSIRFYDPATGHNYTVLQWSGLNFPANKFQSIAQVDNYLGLTEKSSAAPRLMDVWSVGDLYLILGSSDFREYHISFHKWAPVQPPIAKGYYDGITDNREKFDGKVFQFSYRYVYQGNLRSRYSPVSNAVQYFNRNLSSGSEVTAIEISIPGFTLDNPGAATAYNYFNNNNVKFYSVVEQIELVYREGQNDVWKILQRYDVRTSLNQTFRYDGDSNSTPISDTDFTQIFDAVPFRAGTIEVIDNRFVFGDTLEEKSIAPPVQVTNIGIESWQLPEANSTYWNRGNNVAVDNAGFFSGMSAGDADELGHRNYVCKQTFKGRGIYKLGIQWIAENGWRSAVYTTDNWIYEIPEESGSVDKIYALKFKFPNTFQPPEWAVAYQIVRTNCLNIDYFLFGPCNLVKALVDDNSGFTDDVQIAQATRDRIRQHFEDARTVTGKKFDDYLTVLKNKNFAKSIISDVRKTAAALAISDASRLYIDISNWYNSSSKSAGVDNNPLNNLYYNYREGKQAKLGDRVRFVASTNATPSDAQKAIYDMPILEFSGRGIIVEKPPGVLWLPGNSSYTDAVDMMIEVYSPYESSKDDYLYHETGEWYPVLYPGTDQREMSKRDWDYTNNAAVTCATYGDFRVFNKFPFTYGDCHQLEKTYYFNYQAATGITNWTPSTASMVPDVNRTFDFWERANGRSYPAYTDFPTVRFKPTMVRFGGQIVDESNVNNINRFREEDSKIFPSEYGRIRALVNTQNAQVESVGAILLAIGERETFSIYVNRTSLEDLSGRSQVSLSDKVLGSYNTLLGSHGTLNPESISCDRGRVYYWDAVDGTWIRYGRDGLTEISFYKMRNWFRELGALLVTKYNDSTDPWVTSEFDPFNEELVTRIDHADLPATFRDYENYKGSLFSEEDKRWKSCHTWAPEMFARINTQLVSFVAGTLYLHEQGAGYSTFYGVKQDVYIEPVASSKNMEVWGNIQVTSTHKWSVTRFLSEYRGASAKRQSSLALDQMEYREDKYVSAIKGDVNAGGAIEGDRMRSRAIRAMLKLDPSVVTESLLHYVDIQSIDSPKNP